MPEFSLFDDYPDYLLGSRPAEGRAFRTRAPSPGVSRDSPRGAFRSDVPPKNVITVARAVARLRDVLGGMLSGLWISGEVSNLSRPASGHVYFTLKDGDAQIRCVYFAQSARRHPVTFKTGDRIEVSGTADVYARGGELQIRLTDWRHAGAGALYEAYLRLKAKLAAEGFFDEGRKKALPRFVRSVVVVTSEQAAALQDVLRTVSRRTPWVQVTLAPAFVQGEEAPASLCAALRRAEVARPDVILLVRGGGSFEDLLCFSDEQLVRTVCALTVPVVAGIGHESDESLAGLAADLCTSTPTAAAEALGPDLCYWRSRLDAFEDRLTVAYDRAADDAEQRLDRTARQLGCVSAVPARLEERVTAAGTLLERLTTGKLIGAQTRLTLHASRLQSPDTVLEAKIRELDRTAGAFVIRADEMLENRAKVLQRVAQELPSEALRLLAYRSGELASAARHMPDADRMLGPFERRTESLSVALAALDPGRPLRAGYVRAEKDGTVVMHAADLADGDLLTLCFNDGTRTARITGS